MSFNIQLLSDLHLETPLIRPLYSTFKIPPRSRYLALLGDIGYASDPRLFTFLELQLQHFQLVFFLLGNHEPYNTSFPLAKARIAAFATEMEDLHRTMTIGKFVLLDQTRYDVSAKLSILGCTLFSRVSEEQRDTVGRFVTDFHAIQDWDVEQHNAAHASGLAWLNAQVCKIETEEPERNIVGIKGGMGGRK